MGAVRRRDVLWPLASIALHVAVLFMLRADLTSRTETAHTPSAAWLEAIPAPEPPPEPEPSPPPAAAPVTPPQPVRPRRVKSREVSTAPVIETTEVGEGVSVEASGEAVAAEGVPGGTGEQPTAADSGEPAEIVNERPSAPAQLSMWLNPPALERYILLRPAQTVLMAVPGYRDVFRGSSVRPFLDLQLLRLFLVGVQPERLVVAGVHAGGEDALVQAAARVAAMRSFEVDWRGGSDLRATAWIDNSGFDRGLAVHEGAFLIGARDSLPSILGATNPGDRVVHLSKLRRGVIMAVFIEDLSVYVPALTDCGLEALHVSVAAQGGEIRMSFVAHYASSAFASRAAMCLGALAGPIAAQAPSLLAWLQSATGPSGSFSTQLRTVVSRAEVERLFDEISAALRRTTRS